MSFNSDVEKNWGNIPTIFEQGVETLPQLLIYQAKRFGDRTFHRKKDLGIWQRFTFNDVLDNVKTFALGLAHLGVKRNHTVGIVGENEPELFWSEYAAQSLGAKCGNIKRTLHIFQLTPVIVGSFCGFAPPQKDVGRGLHKALANDHAFGFAR